MIDYIKGEITELTPAYVVLETAGTGYFIHITLPTFSFLSEQTTAKLYVYEAIREDAYVLYGFRLKRERQLFLLLISVSGIGANTARMIMSSYLAQEIQEMIVSGNVSALNAIKGVGYFRNYPFPDYPQCESSIENRISAICCSRILDFSQFAGNYNLALFDDRSLQDIS